MLCKTRTMGYMDSGRFYSDINRCRQFIFNWCDHKVAAYMIYFD